MIPDCYDPVYQEEQRQRQWDEYMAKLPVCRICGHKIQTGEKAYETHGRSVCAYCMDDLMENPGYVEVD